MRTFTTAGRLIGTASAAALLLLGLEITAAPSNEPSFTKATATLDPLDFDYVATWTETGLGRGLLGERVNYQLVSKNSSSTWQCIGPNFKPRGQPQPGATGEATNEESLKVENGRVKGMLILRLSPGKADCHGNEFLCHVSVSYTDNSITDTSNGVSAPLPDISSQIPLPIDERGLAGNCFFP
jgi:hypothetical protein